MAKQEWKPGNMIYPLPAVMVTVGNEEESNIITVGWTGTVCTNPAMAYISVRPERYSHKFLMETKEFVINLTTEALGNETDYCGVKSGRDVDKWKEMNLTKGEPKKLKYTPIIEECPVNIECEVVEVKQLGSHDMFLAKVVSVQVSEEYMNANGKFELNKSDLLVYSHGEYLGLGDSLGTFGYSIKKPVNPKKKKNHKNKK